MQALQRVINAWFERDRDVQPQRYWARTRDGWRLALYRYRPPRGAHATPVVLCHGMSSNRWDMDGPGRLSLARYLRRRGYDVWLIELRGAGRSMRPSWWNGKTYTWSFEDYVQHDAPAALRVVLRESGARQVHWVGHSMGGMIAYALLMSPMHGKIASAVTIGSPTMSDVGHPVLDFGLPYRGLLRYLPRRVPLGTAARLGAPFAGPLARLLRRSIADLGFHPGNADPELLRALMLIAVDDVPASLLREFARWYDTRAMSDRYQMFDFTEHLERVTTPVLIIAGSHDELTPVRDLQAVHRRIASADKEFRVIGRDYGDRHNYSHADLILGRHAPDDVYPVIGEWLERHRRPAARRRRLRAVASRR
jgi:alpha-beta hydrolase superfamily lysophospholipase